ncbi:alpha/beta fold hydrolase [Acinetobacter sp.]|uniref:alpha/beta fold hydrolase n=1 Tax=Acinetobacter sp. TaxID=472 RepID=UPI0035B315E3
MPHYSMPDQERLYVREIGHGAPVLVLSGLGMSSWQWLPYIAPSLRRRKFYIPDFRGFGQSKHCKIPTDAEFKTDAIASHWRDVNCLLEQISQKENLENGIDVIAYSMGATTTMHGMKYGNFAAKIKQYIHIDQSACIRNQTDWEYGLYGTQQATFLNILDRMLVLLLPYLDQHLAVDTLPHHVQNELISLFNEFVALQSSNAFISFLDQFQITKYLKIKSLPFQTLDYLYWYLKSYQQHNEDYRQTLISFTKPAYFLIGKHSALYPADGQIAIAKQLSDPKIHIFPRAGHALIVNQPLFFTQTLNQLL